MRDASYLAIGVAFAIIMAVLVFAFGVANQGNPSFAVGIVDTPADGECALWSQSPFGVDWSSCQSGDTKTITATANTPSTALGTGVVSIPHSATVTDVFCIVSDAGTIATPTIDIRSSSTPFTSGTALLTADLGCDDAGETSTSFNQATITADQNIAFSIGAVSTTTIDQLYVRVRYTID